MVIFQVKKSNISVLFHILFLIFLFFQAYFKPTDPKSNASHENQRASSTTGTTIIGLVHKKKTSIFQRALADQIHPLQYLENNLCESSTCDDHIRMLKSENLKLLEENIKIKSENQILKIQLSEAVSADVTDMGKNQQSEAVSADVADMGNLSLHDNEIFEAMSNDNMNLIIKSIEEDEWKELKSIPLNKRNDASYIRRSMDIVYKNDQEGLTNRTVSGRSKKMGKMPELNLNSKVITPEKKDLITELFRIRIQKLNITDALKQERFSETMLNRHMTNALGNLKRKIKTENRS